ncbi:MAG TPA: hypothetical protein VIR63_05590 [Pontiella sp.]
MNTEKHRFHFQLPTAIFFVFWLSVLLLAGCAPEKPKILPQHKLTVEHSIDRNSIMVGDPVELIITAYHPTNSIVTLPEIGREKDIVLLKRDWATIPREDGLIQSESRYSITSFRLGEHIISTGSVSCIVGDHTLSTNFPAVTLSVISSLEADASSEIADIKPAQKLPGRIPPWLWVSTLVALSAFLIGVISSRLWRKRSDLAPGIPAIPPHIVALQSLEALTKKGLLEQDDCKSFYTELSLILRTYLEGRFNLNAPDETTEEIVDEMSRSPELGGAHRNILQEFMRQADMVKFAKGHAGRTTMEAAFETTKKFIEETQSPADQTDRPSQSGPNK